MAFSFLMGLDGYQALLRRGWSDLALQTEEAERHQVDLLDLRIRPQRGHQRPGAERAGGQGLGDATLYINRIPCRGPRGCAAMLPRMLPEGASLRVIGPGGYDQTFLGLPD